jgi:hypothetical protein
MHVPNITITPLAQSYEFQPVVDDVELLTRKLGDK